MIAAVLTKPQRIELQKVTPPTINENEIKIKVEGCGICASSLPLWEGREWFSYPVEPGSPGHEGWGIVESAGDKIASVNPGDRVAFLSYHAFAEYDVAKEGSFVRLPETLASQPFPGEPLGCVINIFNRSGIAAGDTVAVIGSGFLGAMLCQLAKHRGARVIAISRRASSLQYARRFGAHETVPLTAPWEVNSTVAEITGNSFCNRVIEATGKQEGLDIATEIVAEGGKIIIAGYHQDGLRQINMQQWNWKGIDIINAHERDPGKYLTGMQNAVEAVTAGILNPTDLYTDILPLAELNKGFALTATRPDGFMKALIKL